MDASADVDVLWALLAARVASFSMLLRGGGRRPSRRSRARPGRSASSRRSGRADLAANACFAAATNEGLLSVVSVLASLYPVVTVLLARAVLGERVRRVQGFGIAAALVGVALIASGA